MPEAEESEQGLVISVAGLLGRQEPSGQEQPAAGVTVPAALEVAVAEEWAWARELRGR